MSSLNTDLNVTPFFDDFDEGKQYHRVLFRPSFPVQARELTQLQTILQNQIDRFGEHIFTEGSIIKGANFQFINNYNYIKILDLTIDGIDVDLDSYVDVYAIDDATGLKAITIETTPGLQSDEDGVLNAIYLKYLNSGSGSEIQFANGATITLYSKDFALQRIDVLTGGTGYTNTEAITVTGGSGSGANGYVITYSNSTIREVVLSSGGSGYTSAPTIGVTSAGTGATFSARHYIDKISIANSSFLAPVGQGFAFAVDEGVVFQKGHFVKVEPQSVIVSPFDTNPNNVVVGFNIVESVVNNSIDTSLNDNANGFSNFQAPGAYRLKLTPTLNVLTKEEAAANTTFFNLVEFQNGGPIRQQKTAKYNEIGKEMARRTQEESGSYVVSKFKLTTESIASNTTHLNLFAGTGTAYVDGYRIEVTNPTRVPFPIPTETATETSQSISLNYGNYTLVKELIGSFALNTITAVTLRNATQDDITEFGSSGSDTTASSDGTAIGTAYVKGLEWESGVEGSPTAQYRLYLFGVKMNAGYSFKDVRGVTATGVACNLVLENGIAVLTDNQYNTAIYPTGLFALKNFASGTTYTFRHSRSAQFASNGSVQITLSGSEEFPYGVGALNSTQKHDFIIIPTATGRTSNLAGTVTVASGNNQVTGSGTAFLTDFEVGDYIVIDTAADLRYARITSIANNTFLTISLNSGGLESGVAYARAFPANIPVNFGHSYSTITVGGAQSITVSVGKTLNSTLDFTLYYNGREDNWFSTKAITKNAYTRISNNALANTTTNRWCIGHADVHKLVGVYKTANNSTWGETTDVTSHFALDTGQKDTHYGLAHLVKKPQSTLTLDGTTNLVVKYDVFTVSSSKGYFTVDSYPLSNTLPVESNKISWIDIPLFSSINGRTFDLRDSIDTRNSCVNTAVIETSVITNATVDPSSTEAFSGTVYQPSPNQTFVADISYYLPRVDRVSVDTLGYFAVNKGVAATKPRPPQETIGTHTLAFVNIPPFPAIATNDGAAYARQDHTITLSVTQNRRYTMKDLERLEQRIKQLEYYTSLNALELDTKNLVLPSESNTSIERFKNGFIVDPFIDYKIAATNSPELKIAIDTGKAVATPTFIQSKFDVEANSYSGTQKTGNSILLSYTQVPLITQPVANRFRIATQSAWNFRGVMSLSPSYDNFISTSTNPVLVDMNFSQYLQPLLNSVNDAFSQIHLNQSTSHESTTFQTGSSSFNNGQVTSTVTWGPGFTDTTTWGGVTTIDQMSTINTDTTRWDYLSITPNVIETQVQHVGDFITNFAMQPYMRAARVVFRATGLRPATRHYPFFDRVDVTDHCVQMTHNTGGWSEVDSDYYESGVRGGALTADENGTIVGAFYLPEGQFFVGEREFRLINVDTPGSWDTAISQAITKYNAFNFDQTKSSVSVQTGGVTAGGAHVVNESVVTTQRQNFTRTTNSWQVLGTTRDSWNWGWDGGSGGDGGGGGDPLAQSFLVEMNLSEGSEGLYLTSVDLYFKSKDPVFGVAVQIRSVIAGVPTREVLVGKRIASSQVSVSDDASLPTNIVFNSPIFLKADQEYAVVILPEANSPEYEVWTGTNQLAEGDQATGEIYAADWAKGAMFLSTNGSTWTAMQGEDVKFTLYFAQFTTSTGTVTMQNDAREFLTLTSTSGILDTNDRFALFSNAHISGVFVASANSNIIASTNTSVVSQVTAGRDILLFKDSGSVANLTGTVSVNATSNVVTGSGTTFDVTFANNDIVYVNMGGAAFIQARRVTAVTNAISMIVDKPFASAQTAVGYHKVTPEYDVATVRTVTSNATHSILTLDKNARSSTNATNFTFGVVTVSGFIDETDSVASKIVLRQSTANTSTYFDAGSYFVAADGISQLTGVVGSVDEADIGHFDVLIDKVLLPGSQISVSANVMNSSNTLVGGAYAFGVTNLLNYEGKVRSASLENKHAAGVKSFTTTLTLENSGMRYSSPVVSAAPASILRYAYNINNDVTAEHTQYGNSAAKYITKQIILADGLDAEDLKVYITAYKPVGAEIRVYAKILSKYDDATFNSKNWSLLQQVTSSSVYSSPSNPNDFREFEYTFYSQPVATTIQNGGVDVKGTITGSNTTINTSAAANSTVSAGNIVVVSNDSGSYNVRTVASANTTVIVTTVATNLATGTMSGFTLKKVDNPESAFKNYDYTGSTDGEGIVRYFDEERSAYDGYKYLAIKVVLTSPSFVNVPRLDDVRAIACTV